MSKQTETVAATPTITNKKLFLWKIIAEIFSKNEKNGNRNGIHQQQWYQHSKLLYHTNTCAKFMLNVIFFMEKSNCSLLPRFRFPLNLCASSTRKSRMMLLLLVCFMCWVCICICAFRFSVLLQRCKMLLSFSHDWGQYTMKIGWKKNATQNRKYPSSISLWMYQNTSQHPVFASGVCVFYLFCIFLLVGTLQVLSFFSLSRVIRHFLFVDYFVWTNFFFLVAYYVSSCCTFASTEQFSPTFFSSTFINSVWENFLCRILLNFDELKRTTQNGFKKYLNCLLLIIVICITLALKLDHDQKTTQIHRLHKEGKNTRKTEK